MKLYDIYCDDLLDSGLDEDTLISYRQKVRDFLRWKGERQLTPGLGMEFLNRHLLRGKRRTDGTVNVYASALKRLFKLTGQTLPYRARRGHTKPPAYNPRSHIERLLAEALRGPQELRARDLAVCSVLYFGGLRRSEAANLRVGDIDLERRVIRVHRKRGREQVIPLPERAILPLRRVCRNKPATALAFDMSDHSIYALVGRLARRAGLKFSPHDFRHAYASHLLERKASLREIQELLGHSDLATTSIYLQVTPEHLRSAVDRLDDDPVPQDEVPRSGLEELPGRV